jgi:hypothetical protein
MVCYSLTNNLTLEKIGNIILISILGKDFTLPVMRVLEAGTSFFLVFTIIFFIALNKK